MAGSLSRFVVLAAIQCAIVASRPSAGCGKTLPADLTRGGSVFRSVQIEDPDVRLGVHRRQYKASVPNSYDENKPMPLLFYFHGQSGSDQTEDDKFVQLGNQELSSKEAFLVVSPKGMSDGAKRYGDCAGTSTAWNVGNAGRLDICTRACQPAIHLSCLHTANVSNCNWATCYDDFHNFRLMLESLKNELCIDESRIYATGVSNGAMFLYALTPKLPPGTFAAAVPWYGAYLLNMQEKPPSPTPLLHLHGVLDDTIPAEGTYADQYYYTSLNATLQGWAEVNGCDVSAGLVSLTTPFDGHDKGMRHTCVRFQRCRSGAVVRCLFQKQAHGFWPTFGEEMTWWFMQNYSSTSSGGVIV